MGVQGQCSLLMSTGGPFPAGSNVSSYVGMVCDLLRNSLPKAAVHCQVREAKRSLLDHFYTQVGKKEVRRLILFMFCVMESPMPPMTRDK